MPHPVSQALGVLIGLAVASTACAQAFPSKPIRYIVPFPPGGPTDTFSRALTAQLGEALGQPVVVENVPGAAASIGMDRVAKSAPDGYTIGLATTGSHAINPHLYGAKLPYNALKDFTPLTLAVSYVNILVVNPAVPARTVGELVAYAKANPGKVNFGSAGNGSSNHLSGELLKTLTGAPMQHIPYKGSAPALTDVVSGQLTFMFDILDHLPAADRRRPRARSRRHEREAQPVRPGRPDDGRVRRSRLRRGRQPTSGSASWRRPACRSRSSRSSTAS